MNTSLISDRTLALSGIFQSAALVKQLARTGRVEEKPFLTSIASLFTLEATSVLEIYQNAQHITLGLQTLIDHFEHPKKRRISEGALTQKALKNREMIRYMLSMLHLERMLSKDPKMLAHIRTGIARAQWQTTHFSLTHDNVMANLASLYTDTLSTFRFRIQVAGEPFYLNQAHILNKVKALLLAGIRSAVLWHQLGGRNWQFLISRSAILNAAQTWLQKCEATIEVGA